MSRRIGIVIQARVGSSRLPAKVLHDLGGIPLIGWVISRARLASRNDQLICAIPDTPANDELERVCQSFGAEVVRGSESDVLSRYQTCCTRYGLSSIVRITGDCPLIDPSVIDRVIEEHERHGSDITANPVDEPGGFPRGMDVEAVGALVLLALDGAELEPQHREHVTLYLREHPERFSERIVRPAPDEEHPELRLCVDHPDDLEVVRAVVRDFASRVDFSLAEITRFLVRNPEVAKQNERFQSPTTGTGTANPPPSA